MSALDRGEIDAGHTWEPTKSHALARGYKILGKAGDVAGIITDVLAFSSHSIEERPDAIKAIVKSILEARDFLHTNRKEALRIIAPLENMSEEEMDEGINGVAQPDLMGNLEAMKDTPETGSLYGSGRIIADFYSKRGQLLSVPNLAEIVEPKFLIKLTEERQKHK